MPLSVLPQASCASLPSSRPGIAAASSASAPGARIRSARTRFFTRARAGLTPATARRRSTGWLILALLTVIVVAELVLSAVPAHAAESEPNEDLTPDLKALIAKERIRQRTGPRGAESRNPRVDNDSQNCGTVDIGNSQEARGRSARERMNPRQQTVIVTGPVVNAARCR